MRSLRSLNVLLMWDYAEMRQRLNSYTAYSVACAVVWAVILIAVAAAATTAKLHIFLLIFAGWAIGWTSATIARYVYPPPKSRTVRAPNSVV